MDGYNQPTNSTQRCLVRTSQLTALDSLGMTLSKHAINQASADNVRFWERSISPALLSRLFGHGLS
jgi:hypothetical protein